MVIISRVTEASNVPVTLLVTTNRVSRYITVPGPMSSIEIPGNRLFGLEISTPQLYGIRVVANDVEYRLSEIDNLSSLWDVQAILIYDGFVYVPGGYPGYTIRPQHVVRDRLLETGQSFLYPGGAYPPPYYQGYGQGIYNYNNNAFRQDRRDGQRFGPYGIPYGY